MARRDFNSMLNNINTKDDTNPAPQPSSPQRDKPDRNDDAPTSERAGGIGYDQLERKEIRLHERQYADLTAIARRINKKRRGQGHRITENTLIRLGIDLLLRQADSLQGTTETELAQSLELPYPQTL